MRTPVAFLESSPRLLVWIICPLSNAILGLLNTLKLGLAWVRPLLALTRFPLAACKRSSAFGNNEGNVVLLFVRAKLFDFLDNQALQVVARLLAIGF